MPRTGGYAEDEAVAFGHAWNHEHWSRRIEALYRFLEETRGEGVVRFHCLGFGGAKSLDVQRGYAYPLNINR